MAATVPGAATIGISQQKKQGFKKVLGLIPERNDHELYALFRADSLNRFYVPAVMMGHQEPAPPTSRSVHILGYDERSKFLSHSLHGVYDSVTPIQPVTTNTYGNVSRSRDRKSGKGWVEPNDGTASAETVVEKDGGHISNLVVAGPASHAVKLLQSVKHRVDDRTAICYMQDGLGIAEAVNNKVFTDPESRPSIILGHMGHALAKDRTRDAIRSMVPESATILTGVRPYLGPEQRKDGQFCATTENNDTWLRTQGMLSNFAAAHRLRARGVPLESWLSMKIPSLMFASIADPICVLLDYRYEQLIHNPTAHRLVDQLLNETADVVAHMPEIKSMSPQLEAMLRGEGMRKHVFNQLRAKRDAPSKMVLQIQRGQLTDIEYLNGYFIKRGRKMGLAMPANEMVVGLVKAKHKAELQKLRSYIPLEVTSRR